ncbi:protein ELYS isoform X3 [Plutella xylostella]|uniref:protein ELYS isoform X3 n=1 Tax=Plutella xylostella TaxID=51655 RepID=UPI002032DE88|nr:protein ELYS isoform X3 [Plutella xylostella]
MQRLQDSVFSIVKTTNLSPAVFNYLQPTEDNTDKTPFGGILSDTKYGWLALGPKFCVIDLRTGLKVAAWTFSAALSTLVTCVVELPTPLTEGSKQLVISLECEGGTGIIAVFHVNGSQVLRCIQTDCVVTNLSVCDCMPDGPFTCFDGVVLAGTKSGEIFAFDLNRASLIEALKDTANGLDHLVRNEQNMVNVTFLPMNAVPQIEEQRELAIENDDHLAILLNENSIVDGQYLFHNPDGSIRMKARRDHVRVSTMQYIPQLGSLAIGFNFGAFQIWNLMTLELEFTSQVNVECLPVTHFGFQEPCDDPRAFCYLWAVYSVADRFEEQEFPLAVMHSLTYQGKRLLDDGQYLYQDFSTSTIRFQMELSSLEGGAAGGRCVSCRTHSIATSLGEDGEDNMLNLVQLVWECWGSGAPHHAALLFDLDQWYKAQMPSTYPLQSSPFTHACALPLDRTHVLGAALCAPSVAPYASAHRLEEHFYPNSLSYNCIVLSTSEATLLNTTGIQRQVINSLLSQGGSALLAPHPLYKAAAEAGLLTHGSRDSEDLEEQRRALLTVALEARLSRFLTRCAHDWATGTHSGAGCTLALLIDWAWQRAIELKQSVKDLTAPLFVSSSPADRAMLRSLAHCVRQLAELTGLLDAVSTQCCRLMVPDALSELEERHACVSCVCVHACVVQWCACVGLLPARGPPAPLQAAYRERRIKLHRLHGSGLSDSAAADTCCPLLYIDQLIAHQFGDQLTQIWKACGSANGLYPPPSLYALLRVYLLPGASEQDKHALLLYLLVDYCALHDELRDEAVIRRLMQFPTMFGLSNTAIKATQAFWHLDHRDFDFALDQLQCLTGNTLSDWQHGVVLSALLAQNKTQAALHYLHVRGNHDSDTRRDVLSSEDKLNEWMASCQLHVARGLVASAVDLVRNSAANAAETELLMTSLLDVCRTTGKLSQLLQVSLLPHEERIFTRYLERCGDTRALDILVMYYLQQARYLEAQIVNNKIRSKSGDSTRDIVVDAACRALPRLAPRLAAPAQVAALHDHIVVPKPLSVYVQATSPKNTFTYKSSFIQTTIENASETWVNKPGTKKGLKRALEIEETPFLCTPKLHRSRSIFPEQEPASLPTPAKRPKLPAPTPVKVSAKLSREMAQLLAMPDVSPVASGAVSDCQQHSILKVRPRPGSSRAQASPVDSRYLGDSDDELMDTASVNTHYSDSKHLRFEIPTASESGSTPSPTIDTLEYLKEKELSRQAMRQSERDTSRSPVREIERGLSRSPMREIERGLSRSPMRETGMDRGLSRSLTREKETDASSYSTASVRSMRGSHILESPPKKMASDESIRSRKTYKDTVRARQSLSISANSSLSEDPNSSVESIADLPVTLFNPRHKRERDSKMSEQDDTVLELQHSATPPNKDAPASSKLLSNDDQVRPRSPLSRRSIRTPERQDSPVATPLLLRRDTRSRSRTPEVSPRSLDPIAEQPKQETLLQAEHAASKSLSVPGTFSRSRSRTPERIDKVAESPKLEPICESPSKSDDAPASPVRRSLRSRSRTPEVEPIPEPASPKSPRTRRSKTPDREKLLSPVEKPSRNRKSLSRMVLEHNAFAKTKAAEQPTEDLNATAEKSLLKDSPVSIECTPMKSSKLQPSSLLDITFSPIVNKSVLQSSVESGISENIEKEPKIPNESLKVDSNKSMPAFTTISETFFEKSVLKSYQSSVGEVSSIQEERHSFKEVKLSNKSLGEVSSLSNRSVLRDESSLLTSDSDFDMKDESVDVRHENIEQESAKEKEDTNAMEQKEKQKIVEIQREINEIEEDISEDESESDDDEEIGGEEEIHEDSEESSEEESAADGDEVISIGDSSDDSTSGSEDKLEIDEKGNADSNQEIPTNAAGNNENIAEVNVETAQDSAPTADEVKDDISAPVESSSVDPLNQAGLSILTDDNSVLESDHSDVNLNYSDEKKEDEAKTEEGNRAAEIIEQSLAEVEEVRPQVEVNIVVEVEPVKETVQIEPTPEVSEDIDVVDAVTPTPVISKAIDKDILPAVVEERSAEATKDDSEVSKIIEQPMETEEKEPPRSASRSRKRASSTSSNKSTKEVLEKVEEIPETIVETETTETAEAKTPSRVKRTKSTSSNVSETQDDDTPSKRRGKTPTSTEVRRILTRRASKELSESKIMDDSRELDDSISLTPKKRTARSRSKNLDDNASVASDSSVKSTKSKASVSEEGDVKSVRKTRKSILITKPDLSVIPEMSTDDAASKTEDSAVMNELTGARRLTRHQKSLLESWLEHKPASPRRAKRSQSREPADDDVSSTARMSRAASETKTLSTAAKPLRRGSVDVAALQAAEPGSPAAGSPGRARRVCFSKACEALATPKSRRLSTDVKHSESGSQAGSPAGSEAEATPARRTRRAASNASNSGRLKSVESMAGSPAGSEAEATPARRTRRNASNASNSGRLKSVESGSQAGSPAGSEAEATPARRTRRAASNASSSGRSKKTAALDESKDKK